MNNIAIVTAWRIFQLNQPEPHLQLSFATSDGLLVKNLCLKHPRRTKTIQFVKSIGGEGNFRSLVELQEIIKRANFRPDSVEWRYDRQGDKEIVKVIQKFGP